MKTNNQPGLSAATVERAVRTLRLLAHPERLRIMDALERENAMPVHGLMARLGMGQAAVSHHLGKLKSVGLLTCERRGREVWYGLADRSCTAILSCIRKGGEA